MGKTQLFRLAVASAAVAGCVSSKVTASAPTAVDFHRFQTVKPVVSDSDKTADGKEGLPMFENRLKGSVLSLGNALWEAEPEMVANVTGNQSDEATRLGLLSFSVRQIGACVKTTDVRKK